MKIGIDCRLWNETGIGRYTRNLVKDLTNIDKDNEYVLFVKTLDEESVKSFLNKENKNVKLVIADIAWHSVAEQVFFPRKINRENIDLMHFPYFSVPVTYKKPFVVTVHDLIVNQFNTGRASTLPYPIYLAKRAAYHTVLTSAIYRAKKIITPSESVKKAILKTYRGIKSSKIEVTYEGGFEDKNVDSKLRIKDLNGRYLLRVGNFYPHKNVERLVLAFSDFFYDSYENHNVKLVLVGKRDFFYKRIEKIIYEKMLDDNVKFIENATDADLKYLYENATATVVPSLAEGFSLTSVEAMGMGSPLLLSDIPVHREICGAAAIYCNPADVHDIKHKIKLVCSMDEKSRKEMIEQGKIRAKEFSWQKMAQQTLAIYKNSV